MATVSKIINAASLDPKGYYTVLSTDKDKRLLFTVSAKIRLTRSGLAVNEGCIITTWADNIKVVFVDDNLTSDIRHVLTNKTEWVIPGRNISISAERIDKDNHLLTGNLI